jgi:hypothetical protein
MARPKK